jgi:hypothetical protein
MIWLFLFFAVVQAAIAASGWLTASVFPWPPRPHRRRMLGASVGVASGGFAGFLAWCFGLFVLKANGKVLGDDSATALLVPLSLVAAYTLGIIVGGLFGWRYARHAESSGNRGHRFPDL